MANNKRIGFKNSIYIAKYNGLKVSVTTKENGNNIQLILKLL